MHETMQAMAHVAAVVPGLRPVRAEELAREASAANSALPKGVSRWALMAALRGAARRFALTTPMLRLLEHYMDLSYDADWAFEAEPIIPVPLCEIAEALGRSERQIRNIERKLAAVGLLIWRDAGNHHRKGRRCGRSGRLIWAYGPSLGPMRARAAEILAAAAQDREERREARQLRLGIAALRRQLVAMVATGSDVRRDHELEPDGGTRSDATRRSDKLPASLYATIADTLARVPPKAPAGTPLAVLRARRTALKTLQARITDMHARLAAEKAVLADRAGATVAPRSQPDAHDAWPETARAARAGQGSKQRPDPYQSSRFGAKTSGKAEKTASRIPIQSKKSMNGSCSTPPVSLNAAQDRSARAARHTNPPPSVMPNPDIARASGLHRISLRLVQTALKTPKPLSWCETIDQAERARSGFGITHALWAQACTLLGRRGAALCVFLVGSGLARRDAPILDVARAGRYAPPQIAGSVAAPIAAPDRYFGALLARARRGRLDLAASYFALAQRAETPAVRACAARSASQRESANDAPGHVQ